MSNVELTTDPLVFDIQYHTIQGEFVPAINARTLFEQLHNGWQFSKWIANRIEAYGFVQEMDYLFYPEYTKNRGRPETVYMLTLDMAKEL